ncbi:keto-deoxy-phosphogluconate aldolase, partial [Rhodanobacter lindaniclasticus]
MRLAPLIPVGVIHDVKAAVAMSRAMGLGGLGAIMLNRR